MKLQLALTLTMTVLAAPSLLAERVLWTETATIKTKTIFDEDGSLLYQQNWDKTSGDTVGKIVDNRGSGSSSGGGGGGGFSAGGGFSGGGGGGGGGGGRLLETHSHQHAHGHVHGHGGASAGQDWMSGPFQAPPRTQGGALNVRPAADGSFLQSPEGMTNASPEWSRLYHESQAPLPERDAHGLPAPPPRYPEPEVPYGGGEPPLVGRALHPQAPDASDKRYFNRVGGKVMMRPDNMVRVKVLDHITSKRNKRGDTFRYVLLEPIMYGLRTLVPAGTKGVGRISRAKSRGFFGRPGMLDLEFGSVDLPGATPARIYLAETVISPEPREPEAVGAGAVGLVAFGPLGLAGGALIRGHDVTVEAGSVFHVEVAVDVPYMHTASR